MFRRGEETCEGWFDDAAKPPIAGGDVNAEAQWVMSRFDNGLGLSVKIAACFLIGPVSP